MKRKKRRSCFIGIVACFFLFTFAMIGESEAQNLTIGGNGHSFTTNSLGINSGPNVKRLALSRWYAAMNSGVNFIASAGSTGIAFDGANIWVACNDQDDTNNSAVTVHQAHNGEEVCDPIDMDDQVPAQKCLGPVALAYDGRYMWCACKDNDTVAKISAKQYIIKDANLVTGQEPVFIEFTGDRMWISNNVGDSITVYNATPPSYSLDYTLTNVTAPYGMASDGVNMWVASDRTNNVTIFNLATPDDEETPPTMCDVGAYSKDIAFDGANMWISHFDNDSISILRASDGTLVKQLTSEDGVETSRPLWFLTAYTSG